MIVVKNSRQLREDILKIGTITFVGQLLGYSKAYMSSIITGVRNPNPNIAVGLCELTGKQFDEYFFIQNVHK